MKARQAVTNSGGKKINAEVVVEGSYSDCFYRVI